MKYTFLLCFLELIIYPSSANVGNKDNSSQLIHPVINYYNGTDVIQTLELDLKSNNKIVDVFGASWALDINKESVEGQPDAMDYQLTWKLIAGQAKEVAVGVNFPFKDWSIDNFVLVPSAVYNGNRFEVSDISYPPYWYDKKNWKLDMPTTTTVVPCLSKYENFSKIELTTGNASTPLMAFYAPGQKKGWMVSTTQGNRLGNHGLFIEENKRKSEAIFSITSPAVRKKRSVGAGFAPSGDKAVDWCAGDSVSIKFRVYSFPASSVQDLYKHFMQARKGYNPAVRHEELPFSETWNTLNDIVQIYHWNKYTNMYYSSVDPKTTDNWCAIWQLGWVGGGQVTLPLLVQGTEETRERVIKNLDVIFTKTQAPSGLFNACGNGEQFASAGMGPLFKYNETFVRSQGDWFYMAQRQFRELELLGKTIPAHWKVGLQKLADCFVNIWEKYNQFGHFVDVETGDICIGGSTAGAIIPAGLALASQRFGNKEYLKVAEDAGRKYYQDFVLKGYTTGGPGDILSAPDSESAFALFESFMALYEVTNSKEWLKYASDLLPICASWVVSYDFEFPKESALGRVGAHSCGAVWASVANKHAAPGVCTWSGDCLLKYYRATGDEWALQLVTDMAHGFPQYISRTDRLIGGMQPGGCSERVNLSDWEGKENIGGSISANYLWVETVGLLTVTQIPGLYVQPDKGYFVVFDNIEVTQLSTGKEPLKLRLHNPTKFPAIVKVYTETSKDARKTLFDMHSDKVQLVQLHSGETKCLSF